MKRLVQFVAVLAIGLLAAQPVLFGLSCVAGSGAACAAGCPMATNTMGLDCPMGNQMDASNCGQDCCAKAVPQAVVFAATPEKLKLVVAGSPAPVVVEAFAPRQALAVNARDDTRATSPPRYILDQVFRI